MIELDLSPRFKDGDTVYKALVDAIDSAGEEKGMSMLVRLVLILANQVGDQAILGDAVALASRVAEAENARAGS